MSEGAAIARAAAVSPGPPPIARRRGLPGQVDGLAAMARRPAHRLAGDAIADACVALRTVGWDKRSEVSLIGPPASFGGTSLRSSAHPTALPRATAGADQWAAEGPPAEISSLPARLWLYLHAARLDRRVSADWRDAHRPLAFGRLVAARRLRRVGVREAPRKPSASWPGYCNDSPSRGR